METEDGGAEVNENKYVSNALHDNPKEGIGEAVVTKIVKDSGEGRLHHHRDW